MPHFRTETHKPRLKPKRSSTPRLADRCGDSIRPAARSLALSGRHAKRKLPVGSTSAPMFPASPVRIVGRPRPRSSATRALPSPDVAARLPSHRTVVIRSWDVFDLHPITPCSDARGTISVFCLLAWRPSVHRRAVRTGVIRRKPRATSARPVPRWPSGRVTGRARSGRTRAFSHPCSARKLASCSPCPYTERHTPTPPYTRIVP